MRIRKPCVFDRRLRFGWNVRFKALSPVVIVAQAVLNKNSVLLEMPSRPGYPTSGPSRYAASAVESGLESGTIMARQLRGPRCPSNPLSLQDIPASFAPSFFGYPKAAGVYVFTGQPGQAPSPFLFFSAVWLLDALLAANIK